MMRFYKLLAAFGAILLILLMALSVHWYIMDKNPFVEPRAVVDYVVQQADADGFVSTKTTHIAVNFSKSQGYSILTHGANEAAAIGKDRAPIVDVYRKDMGFDTMRYWLVKPWWKSKYKEPTTLPENFKDDPDLSTIDGMLREAKGTGAELTFVIAHAPDHLLPSHIDPYQDDKYNAGIATGKYPLFRQYVFDLTQYLLYDSPDAIGNDHVVIEIWNEPKADTFSNLGMTYADIINDIGGELVRRYPGITISANIYPYYDGNKANADAEAFFEDIDTSLVPHLRASYHLYNSFNVQDSVPAFIGNSERLFLEGPIELRSFLDSLGEPKRSIPLIIGEHNMHTQKTYAKEMAGKEGAATLAVNLINMVKSRSLSGQQFFKFTTLDQDGFGLLSTSGKKFDNFAVMKAFVDHVPAGAELFAVEDGGQVTALAVRTKGVFYIFAVNRGAQSLTDVPLSIKGLATPKLHDLLSDTEISSTLLDFGPYEVKVLQIR